MSLLSLSARDAAVQRGVLLHAVCPGCLWLAHIPDEEAHMWTLSPGQILLVSGHPVYHSAFSSSLFPSVSPRFRILLSFIRLLSSSPHYLFFLLFSSFFLFPSHAFSFHLSVALCLHTPMSFSSVSSLQLLICLSC